MLCGVADHDEISSLVETCSRKETIPEIRFPSVLGTAEKLLQNLAVSNCLSHVNIAALARFKNLKKLTMLNASPFFVTPVTWPFEGTLQQRKKAALQQAWKTENIVAPETVFLRSHKFNRSVKGLHLQKFTLLNSIL